jgi:hypothetical protein
MTTTFKELPIGARFRVPNIDEIIQNRGDRGVSRGTYGDEYEDEYGDQPLIIQKRDEFGGHIINVHSYGNASVYYRIEHDNVVETV